MQRKAITFDDVLAYKLASLRKAVNAPSDVVLVTGHSGAGKTTLSRQLAETEGLPHISLDDDPAMKDWIAKYQLSDYAGEDAPHYADYLKMQREVALRGLAAASKGGIVEGTQLASLPEDVLKQYVRRILVDPDLETIKSQRNSRLQQRFAEKGKHWDDDVARQKQQVTESLYQTHEPQLRKWRELLNQQRED